MILVRLLIHFLILFYNFPSQLLAISCKASFPILNFSRAIGGLGATIGKSVKETKIIAYEDLGAEAIRRIVVEDLPVTVLTDSQGNDLYKQGQSEYLKWRESHEAE